MNWRFQYLPKIGLKKLELVPLSSDFRCPNVSGKEYVAKFADKDEIKDLEQCDE